jgi:hypothetical protein
MIAGICKECGIVSAMFRESCKEKSGFLITTGWIWCKKDFIDTFSGYGVGIDISDLHRFPVKAWWRRDFFSSSREFSLFW